MSFLKHYKWDIPVTVLVAVAVWLLCGAQYVWPFAILVVLEISLSFDNAVINATVLERLSRGWQRAFLTVGVLVAVFGMRFVFPILIVSLTANLGFGDVIHLALNDPSLYAARLADAHPEIATLGGVYLGMIFLNFFLGEHESFWLAPVEKLLAKLGKADTVSALVMVIVLLVISQNIGGEEGQKILVTGVISLALFLAVQFISSFFESEDEGAEQSGVAKGVKYGVAGLGLFIYLEVQDAAFSFDGVSGAFAITDQVIVIAAGLGVGALFVRSMTVHLVETGKLAEFPFLENGAHWAIGVLATCILTSLYVAIPEWITGLIGVVFIAASVIGSIRYNKAVERGDVPEPMETAAV